MLWFGGLKKESTILKSEMFSIVTTLSVELRHDGWSSQFLSLNRSKYIHE
jgi:hypothetical protein